jgi:hypothetical protein
MAKDSLTHARKTIMGIDLAFGATTGTGCGKRRALDLTSTDLAVITCPACREWRRSQELELASMADAVATLDQVDIKSGMGPDDFRALAEQHRTTAKSI